jgi:DNA-binding MarR family transcriptional regulator
MNKKNEYFIKSNWTTCLKNQLQDFKINLTGAEFYISLYEYAKGGELFFPDTLFCKVGGCFNNYTSTYIRKILNMMERRGLINKSRKQHPRLDHMHLIRFIKFNVHPKKKVDWNR